MLRRLGGISGTIRQTDGTPVGTRVRAYSPDGLGRTGISSSVDGTYTLGSLQSGNYYVYTESYVHRNEVFDDIPCLYCDPTIGTPIAVDNEFTTAGVDFVLKRFGVLQGSISDAKTGMLISGEVALYDDSGAWAGAIPTTGGNFYFDVVPDGVYFARTLLDGFEDDIYEERLYNGIPCDPSCDVTQGDAIPVLFDTTTIIDFSLPRCAFESNATIANLLLFSTLSKSVCRRVAVGPDVVVHSGGELRVTAGESVSIESLSVLTGGRLQVVIDPTVIEP